MNRNAITLGVLIGCAVLAGTVSAAPTASAEQQRRSDLVVQIVEKWGSHVEGVYSRPADAWSKDMVPLLMSTSLDSLQRAANARTFDAMNEALVAKAAPVPTLPRVGLLNSRITGAAGMPASATKSEDSTEALGDADSDLVYVPVEPCRIIDTRLAGGTIAAATARSFNVASASDYTGQGGSATNCNVGNVGTIVAAAINFAAVRPAADGFLTAYAFGATQPGTSTLNYTAGDLRSGLSIVTLDTDAAAEDVTVYTFATTHMIGDIVGYFVQPEATALQCTSTFVTQNIAANQPFNIEIPNCPVSYTVTGAGCRTESFDEANFSINGLYPFGGNVDAFCAGLNTTAGTIKVDGAAQCCRVPGR